MKKFLFIAVNLVFCLQISFAIETQIVSQKDSLPSVFLIGEYEFEYETTANDCSQSLLTVCQDSMELAYKHWLFMLDDIETYANQHDFDIKGIKIWMNVFWDKEGNIDHIVYYPKPNSKNIDFSDLTSLLSNFVENYSFSKENQQCFSHYGSASFPTFRSRIFPDK